MSAARSARLGWILGFAAAAPLCAQIAVGPSQGLRLERDGRYEEAVEAYLAVLDSTPARLSDLLGLERALTRLARLDRLPEVLERAVAAAPDQEVVREIQFRTVATLFGADSARAAARRWADAVPGSRNPYRVLARWLGGIGEHDAAIQVLYMGERETGSSLAEYRAQVHAQVGDWTAAASAWREAVRGNTGFVGSASSSLASAPEGQRGRIVDTLLRGGTPPDHLLLADLLVRWGRVEEAWVALDRGLPRDDARAVTVLRRFAERAGRLDTPEGTRARALAFERIANALDGEQALQARLEAARAYSEAGQPESARRVLDRLQAPATPRAEVDAALTFIDVTIRSGRLEEAERRYNEWRPRLSPDEVAFVRSRLAWAWIQAGSVDRAEAVLESDSSIASVGVRGWIAAYRGNFDAARALLRAAGPAAPSRNDATRRAWLLVLLERLDLAESVPIGAALLQLAEGDSAAAAQALADAAGAVHPLGGRADLLMLAGDIAAGTGQPEQAEAWYREGIAADSAGPAVPRAEFALAVLLHDQGRLVEAKEQLEHLILAHAESALVPQARRLLDDVRGLVPQP